jgi:integrase
MVIKKHKNDLKLLRRHVQGCSKFPGETFQPVSKADGMADKCRDADGRLLSEPCPIHARGYLIDEPNRVRPATGKNDWTSAEKVKADLYEAGSIAKYQGLTKSLDPSDKTVEFAVERFIFDTDRNEKDATHQLAKDTHDHYKVLLNRRLLPWCEDNQIYLIREFATPDVCRRFMGSWRQFRRKIGEPLTDKHKDAERTRFSAFLNFCVRNTWMGANGIKHIPVRKRVKPDNADDDSDDEEEADRHALPLQEVTQLLDAPDSPDLTAQQNQETRVAALLGWENGLRVSDLHKFNSNEIVKDKTGTGKNAHYKQKKNGRWCTSPLTAELVAKLTALPGRMVGKKKYFFTCSYPALRERLIAMAKRAQTDKPFEHHFSPHCLRHSFAMHHLFVLNEDVSLVSKWLGHKSIAVTQKYYSNWITGTHKKAEAISRKGNIKTQKMMAMIRKAASRKQETRTAAAAALTQVA